MERIESCLRKPFFFRRDTSAVSWGREEKKVVQKKRKKKKMLLLVVASIAHLLGRKIANKRNARCNRLPACGMRAQWFDTIVVHGIHRYQGSICMYITLKMTPPPRQGRISKLVSSAMGRVQTLRDACIVRVSTRYSQIHNFRCVCVPAPLGLEKLDSENRLWGSVVLRVTWYTVYGNTVAGRPGGVVGYPRAC